MNHTANNNANNNCCTCKCRRRDIVYKIELDNHVYVGKTRQRLSQRKRGHKKRYRAWKNGKALNNTSHKIFDMGSGWTMEQIDPLPGSQYGNHERDLIIHYKSNGVPGKVCVNKTIPRDCNTSVREHNRNYKRQWNRNNPEKKRASDKRYRDKRKARVLAERESELSSSSSED